jgi:hypothetical protein
MGGDDNIDQFVLLHRQNGLGIDLARERTKLEPSAQGFCRLF